MNAAGRRRLTTPLAITSAVLALLFGIGLAGVGRGVHWAPPRPPAPLPPRQDAKLPAPVPLQQYAVVWQQPLFSPDRKPEARAASGASQLGDLQLTGILLLPGLHMALLHDRNGKDLRVREGDKLPDGSALVELRPRSAVFATGSGRVELKLPTGAPITEAHAPAAPGSEAAPAPEDAGHGQPLDPDSVEAGGEGETKPDAPPPGDQPGADTNSDETHAERQANRLRLLRAAIERRRAADKAAAAAKQGDH